MIEVINRFTGLDLDTSYMNLQKGKYVDALNITLDAIEGNEDDAVTNIIGNRVINYSLPAGTNICVGAVANTVRNTVISIVFNSNGNDSIIEYNLTTRTSAKIFENLTDSGGVDILGLTADTKITGINIYNRDEGDFLFFLDGEGRPSFMNITLFKSGAYTPVTRQIIDVAKIPPPSQPDAVYGNDNTRTSNFLQKELFRFKIRYIYDDNFKSTFSPISAIPLPANILDPVYTNVLTNNNRITVTFSTGAKNVKAIELAVSIQNNQNQFGRFQTVEVIEKGAGQDDTDISYQFYNDSTYPFIADDESLLTFDYVPKSAVAQEMPNGNVLCYGAITEGYSRTIDPNIVVTVNTVAAGSGTSVGSLNGVVTSTSISFRIDFTGVPVAGTVVQVFAVNSPSPPVLVATYTTVAGDNSASVVNGLDASASSIGILSTIDSGNTIFFLTPLSFYAFSSLTINAPATSATTNSIATWPFWGQRRMGIVYYDEKGVTNGVIYDTDITFPGYAENGSQQVLLPYLNVKIYQIPPIWAYSYQLVFTKDNTQFLYIETVDVNISETDFLYFDITNLALNAAKNPTTEAVVSWSFQDGDRMRLIRRMDDNTVYGTAYDSAIEGIVTDPTINNVVQTGKTFVKIRKVAPFSSVNYTSKLFIIQLYRPSLQEPNNENATFYESAIQYPILNPTESNRVHGGQVTNQSTDYITPAEINIYSGDVYFRLRTQYLSETGLGQFNVQDRNFVDSFISAVSNIDGRPMAIEINAAETYFPAMVRFGQAYQPNTNINGLNRFYPNNFDEYDYSYGDIQMFKVRDRFMRVFQKLKVGVVYLFSKVGKSPSGDEVTVVTDQLLNPIQYYNGDYGIGDNKTSLASFNFADYFTSNITGGIYRASLDGIEPLSVKYGVNSWATENITLRSGTCHIYGAYDQRLNNYILALEGLEISPEQTLVFSEESNIFETFLSLYPEMMVTIGTVLCSFKNGEMWTHDGSSYNTFFGTSYESSITPVFNETSLVSKTFQSVEEIGSTIFDCPEIISQGYSYGNTRQQTNIVEAEFTLLENKYAASIKRDANSIGGKINGSTMKGGWISVKFRKQNATNLVVLNSVLIGSVESNLNRR